MRTTLDVADDVLVIAKANARQSRRTLGEVISELARRGLQSAAADASAPAAADTAVKLARLGIRPIAFGRGKPVTNDLVNRIRDEEGI